VSPRVAVIYKPFVKTDLKLMYGRGFRHPSAYDMFYDDGVTQTGNPSLRPETTDTYEFAIEHTFTSRLRASASAHNYQVNNLVEQVFTPAGLLHYVNADRVRAAGISFELLLQLPARIDLASSVEFQRAVFGSGMVLPNSPGQVGKLHLSMPLWHDRLTLSAGVQALGQRSTYAGAVVPWVILPDAVVSTKPLAAGLQFSAGVKNLSNSFYRDPAGLTPTVDSVIGSGRTYYLNVTWHSAERDSAPKARNRPGQPEK
jgi:iron complex outermembrane receptor protein